MAELEWAQHFGGSGYKSSQLQQLEDGLCWSEEVLAASVRRLVPWSEATDARSRSILVRADLDRTAGEPCGVRQRSF